MYEAAAGALVDARLPAMSDALLSLGLDVSVERLAAAHSEAQRAFEAAWALNSQFTTRHASRIMAEHLEFGTAAAAALEEAFRTGSATADVLLVDGAVEAVMAARQSGARTAIVCDIGLTPSEVIVEWLRERELAQAFDCMAFSDRLGTYKPSPEIFDHVFQTIGLTEPVRGVHVGDRRRTDVEGARRRGLYSVRFRGIYDDACDLPEADWVIDSMHEFSALLRMG